MRVNCRQCYSRKAPSKRASFHSNFIDPTSSESSNLIRDKKNFIQDFHGRTTSKLCGFQTKQRIKYITCNLKLVPFLNAKKVFCRVRWKRPYFPRGGRNLNFEFRNSELLIFFIPTVVKLLRTCLTCS